MTVNTAMDSTLLHRTEAAADWLLRLREDDVSEDTLAEWFTWCEDAENLREFQSVSQMWRGMAATDLAAQLKGRSPKTPVAVATTQGEASTPTRARRSNWRRTAWGGAAAALLAIFWWLAPQYPAHHERLTLAVTLEISRSILPDGSEVILAPRTALAVDFAGSLRSLSLGEGEAMFKVHHDKQKPFVVTTAGVTVTAVGTAFNVRSDRGSIVVTVEEGTVSVNGAGADSRVTKGYQITYDTLTRTSRIQAVDPSHVLSWQRGHLEYVSTDLAHVIADIDRYTSAGIEVGDPRLGQLTFTGSIDTNAIQDWLKSVQTIFPVQVASAQDGHPVLLRRHPST